MACRAQRLKPARSPHHSLQFLLALFHQGEGQGPLSPALSLLPHTADSRRIQCSNRFFPLRQKLGMVRERAKGGITPHDCLPRILCREALLQLVSTPRGKGPLVSWGSATSLSSGHQLHSLWHFLCTTSVSSIF